MAKHEFRLILAGKDDVSDADTDALFAAGCDDATFGSRNRIAFGDFDRQADSLEQAIRSAIADVQRAGFTVARVEQVAQSVVSVINAELAETPRA